MAQAEIPTRFSAGFRHRSDGKRRLASHRDVGAQRQVQNPISACAGRRYPRCLALGKLISVKNHLLPARWNVKSISALVVGRRRLR